MALTRSPDSSTNSLIDLLDLFAVLSKEDRSFSKVNIHNSSFAPPMGHGAAYGVG